MAQDIREYLLSLKAQATNTGELTKGLENVGKAVKQTQQRITQDSKAEAKLREKIALEETKLRIEQEKTAQTRIKESSKQILSQINAEMTQKRMAYSKDMQARKAADQQALENTKQVNRIALEDEKQKNRQAMVDYRAALAEKKRLLKEEQKAEEAIRKQSQQNVRDFWNNQIQNANTITQAYSVMASRIAMYFRQAFSDAIEYAKDFDRQMTSIAIVTGDSTQKRVLGERYEDMAQEMKVSSTEIAQAAEELYRQGLGSEKEVEDRLRVITEYAKISGLTFSEAVEAMTAAINSFTADGESGADTARRIADTWAYLGDSVATSSAEIGIAMQKVASSGQAAGVGLEKLSSYIAVIEAYTRAAPESVGTALNSMMSRYMKVTSKGFGASVTTDEGDVVSINDIAKALNEVGISVYTAGQGFLEFGDVLDQVASIWETLDDNQRNYIATQVAGTRGLNYFLALMDGYANVVELTAGAYDSAGVSASKFAIWQDGLEASLSELDAAVKDLYSDLLPADTVKGVTQFITSLVQLFGKATEATNGLNVKLALVAAGLLMVFRAIQSIRSVGGVGAIIKAIGTSFFGLQGAATGATVAITGMKAALASVGIGLAVGAVVTLIGWLVNLSGAAENAKKKIEELNEGYSTRDSSVSATRQQIDTLKESIENGTLSIDEYMQARAAIVEKYPELDSVLAKEKDAVDNLAGAYENLVSWAEKKTMADLSASYVAAAGGYKTAVGSYDNAFAGDIARLGSAESQGNYLIRAFKGHYLPDGYDGYGVEAISMAVEAAKEARAGVTDTFSEEYLRYSNDISILENALIVKMAEAEQQRRDALETIIRAAVDPREFGGNYMAASDVIEQMLAYDWGDASAEEIYAMAKDWVTQYAQGIADAANSDEVQSILDGFTMNFATNIEKKLQKTQWDLKSQAMQEPGFEFWTTLAENLTRGQTDQILAKWRKAGFISSDKQVRDLTSYLSSYGTGEERYARADKLEKMIFTAKQENPEAPDYNSIWDMIYAYMGVRTENGSVVVGEPVDITKGSALPEIIPEDYKLLGKDLKEQLGVLSEYKDFVSPNTGNVISANVVYGWLTSVLGDEAWLALVEELEWMDMDTAHDLISKLLDDYISSVILSGEKELPDLTQFFEDLSAGIGIDLSQPGQTKPRSVEQYTDAVTKMEEMARLSDFVTSLTGDLDEASLTDIKTKDLSKLLEAYPQLVQYMGDMNAMREAAIDLLAAENEEYGWLLEKYGLSIESTKDLSGAVLANITANNKAYAAIRKIQQGYELTEAELTALTKEYPEVTDELYAYIHGTATAADTMNALWKAQSNANAKTFAKNLQSLVASMDDVVEGTDDYRQILDELGNLFTGGIGDMSSYDFAAQYIDQIREAANGSEEALRALQEAAFIHIVGTADVDFTPIRDGLYDVSNLSQETLQVLQGLGLFDIETVDLPMTYYDLEVASNNSRFIGGGARFDDGMGDAGVGNVTYRPVRHTVNAGATVLKFRNSNMKTPTKKSSGGRGGSGSKGGGGGGGGGGSSKASSEVQNRLDALENLSTPIDYRLKIAQGWEEYYQQTGELSKTIPYMEEQIKLHTELSEIYAKNRKELEPLALAQKAQVENIQGQIESLTKLRDQYSSGSSAYKNYDKQIQALQAQLEELLPDYEALVEAVDGYALSEIEAKQAIDELNRKIKEQRTAIRTLRADMKDTLSGYIDNLKEQQRELVDATISMQDTVIDILREEAQKELDLEKEKLDKKKELLGEELTAIRDNYNEAKELASQQAKEEELREKQRQLSLLSTDPTKAKQRAQLEKEIAKLRENMAWDAAENEVSANEEAVQGQIDNLDELITANREAYDAISGYNEELVNKMYEVMSQTEEQMIAWLKEHSTAYAESTKEAQGKLVEEWRDTLNTIYGVLETNWPEVEKLMTDGLDRVIAKMKETTDYMTANSEAQENMIEALTDDWNNMLEAVKLLSKQEKDTNQKSIYDQQAQSASSASSSSSGASATPTGGGASVKARTSGRYYMRDTYSTTGNALTVVPDGASVTVDGYHDNWYHVTYGSKTGWMSSGALRGIDKSKLKQYHKGGLVNFTGPAWLDGTPDNPEGILSPEQTKLFSRFVLSLERLYLPEAGGGAEGGVGGFTVEPGGIVINVERLDGDRDYQEVASGVMNAIYQQFKVRR